MRLLILLSLIAWQTAPAIAAVKVQKPRYSAAYIECNNTGAAAQGVQLAMNQCASDEYERQDAQLNQIYTRVMNGQNDGGKAKLRTLQRGWIKTRDRKCAAEKKEYDGGSMAPLVYLSCMTDETLRRIVRLEKYR